MRLFSWLTAFLLLSVKLLAAADADPSALIKEGKADVALHVIHQSLAHDPKDARAYNLLCRIYFQLELWDSSVHMAEKSVALDPQNGFYHLWLARAMGRKAESSNPFTAFSLARKVKTEFERAVALDGSNLRARSDLSEFYLEAPGFLGGDKNKARQQAEFVAEHDVALGCYILGRVEEKQGTGGAEAEYKKAIAASSSPAHYWVELAHFYRRAGRFSDMEAALNQLAALAQPGEAAEFDAASLLLHTGRNFTGAVDLLHHYISQQEQAEEGPTFQAHYLLGILLEKQGRKKDAAQEFQAALGLASEYHPAQDALARVSR